MKKFILILIVVVSYSAFAQEIRVLPKVKKSIDGSILYMSLDEDSLWLTKSEWVSRYDRSKFRDTYVGIKPEYIEEDNYTRTEVLSTVKVENSTARWERVITDKREIEELKRIATDLLPDPKITEDGVWCMMSDVAFYGAESSMWSMQYMVWEGKVMYEFKEGRYRVKVENIKVRPSASVGMVMRGVVVSMANTYDPLADYIYDGDRPIYNAAKYYNMINDIDYTFCKLFWLKDSVSSQDEW